MRFLIFLFLISCGADDKQGAVNEEQEKSLIDNKTEEETSPISIYVKSKPDLPECNEAKEAMLAYVSSEDAFYSCESNLWVALDIKGKDGKDGKDGEDGVTTTVEVESSNRLNEWIDPVTDLEWLLGGVGTQAAAISACTSNYRMPTVAESLAAIQHGIRNVATDIGAVLPFWTGENSFGSPMYATLVSGNANTVAVASNTANISIFCVKK